MQNKTKESEAFHNHEPLFIGKIIEEELRRQERSVTWLSRKIHCDRRNIYDIFSRTSIDTNLLYRLSIALETDFFVYFSSNLQFTNRFSFPSSSGEYPSKSVTPQDPLDNTPIHMM